MKITILKTLFIMLRLRIIIMASTAFEFISPFEAHLYGEFSVGFIAFVSLVSALLMELNKWLTNKVSYFTSFVLLSVMDVLYFSTLLYLFILHPEIDRVIAAKIAVLIFPIYLVLFAVKSNKNSALENILLNSKEAEDFNGDMGKYRSRVSVVASLFLMGYSYLDLPNTGVIYLFGILIIALIVFIIKANRYLRVFDKLLNKHQSNEEA